MSLLVLVVMLLIYKAPKGNMCMNGRKVQAIFEWSPLPFEKNLPLTNLLKKDANWDGQGIVRKHSRN